MSEWTISHDFAFDYGGAERVTEILAHDVLRDARVWLFAGHDAVIARMDLSERTDLKLSRRLVTEKNYRVTAASVAPIIPHLYKTTGNLLSSSYALAHHIRCDGVHVSYCHSPMRQIWSHRDAYEKELPRTARLPYHLISAALRDLDRRASRHVDHFIATSTVVRRRVENFYKREVIATIPPPVDTKHFYRLDSDDMDDYLLWAGRIVEPYKKLSALVEAVRDTKTRLIVAGDGRDRAVVEASAPANVQFLGTVDSKKLRDLYAGAIALVFPSEDDFGMAPIEAAACGTPTIAFRGGGALDTIVEGVTGTFFNRQDFATIRQAILDFDRTTFDQKKVLDHASAFSRQSFSQQLRKALASTADI